MDNKLLFSIVMPVYNVEKYLRDAVGSVLQQTYPRFELLLVDDCSPDNSPAICDELAASDSRIRVIHKPVNEGPSMARNTGIAEAIGDYISFMDSDDTIDNTLFWDVAESLNKTPAQSVLFGAIEEYTNKFGEIQEKVIVSYPVKTLINQTQLRREVIHIENSTLYGYAWNKFYSLKHIKQKDIKFDMKLTLLEDIRFNVDYFMDASSLNIIDTTPYHYKKRVNGSITNRFTPDYFTLHTNRVQSLKEQYLYWDLYTSEVQKILGNIYCRYIYSALQRNFDKRSNMNNRDRKEWVRNLFLSDLFNELIPFASPDSRTMKILISFLKNKNIVLTLAGSRAVNIVKTKLPMLFVKAKQKK